jgi:hypothetical protein
MKSRTRTIISVILVLTLAALFAWAPHYVTKSANGMTEKLDFARERAEASDWDDAAKLMESFERDWHDIQYRWEMIMPCHYIYEMDECVAYVASLAKHKSKDDFFTELDKLKLPFSHSSDFEAQYLYVL